MKQTGMFRLSRIAASGDAANDVIIALDASRRRLMLAEQ